MIRVYSLLIEPFLPFFAARINYLLGTKKIHAYPAASELRTFIFACLSDSVGLIDPIPLVSESIDLFI